MRTMHTRRWGRAGVAAVAFIFATAIPATAADGPNLVVNGNFAAPDVAGGTQVVTGLPGWTLNDGDVEVDGPDTFALPTGSVAGTQTVDLNTASRTSIEQAVPTVAGKTYKLTYNLAGHPGNGTPGAARVVTGNVRVDGTIAQTINFDTAGHSRMAPGWVSRTYTFTATGSSTVVQFQSTVAGSRGPLITNVTVNEVPSNGAPIANTSIALLLLTGVAVVSVVVVRRGNASTES